MKIAFKVWNGLIIAAAVISIISAYVKAGMLGAGLTLVFELLSIFMAVSGFKENYSLCKKLAMVNLVFGVIGVVVSFSLSSVFSLVLVGVYLYLCISLESKYY
ncbi:MAG: hypothetical protein K5979_02960 [Ruminococcus sp.]|nr:hypothetical protein [Ruminococcus sp.]